VQKALRPAHARRSMTEDTAPLGNYDKVETRRAPLLSYELVNATDGCEIRTQFKVHTTAGGEPVPVLSGFRIVLPLLRDAGGLIVRRVREPVLTTKNLQVRLHADTEMHACMEAHGAQRRHDMLTQVRCVSPDVLVGGRAWVRDCVHGDVDDQQNFWFRLEVELPLSGADSLSLAGSAAPVPPLPVVPGAAPVRARRGSAGVPFSAATTAAAAPVAPGLVLGPFFPSEQHLSLEESHYYIQQEVPLAGTPTRRPERERECRRRAGTRGCGLQAHRYVRVWGVSVH
jgi:hypothetical protein